MPITARKSSPTTSITRMTLTPSSVASTCGTASTLTNAARVRGEGALDRVGARGRARRALERARVAVEPQRLARRRERAGAEERGARRPRGRVAGAALGAELAAPRE